MPRTTASGCSNSPVRPPGCTGMSNVCELLEELPVRGPAADEDGDVAVRHALRRARSRMRLAIQPASSASVSARPDDDLAVPRSARGSVRLPCPSRAAGIVWANRLARSMIWAAAPVRRDLERRDVRIALGEGDDVADVRAAPLVDRLVVVADDAQLDTRAGKQLDQPLLRRVHVLVLVDDQVPQLGVHLGRPARAARAPRPPARSAARR